MKGSIHSLRLTLVMILISFSICSLVSAQWIKKADGLKPRSELGETIVYNSKAYSFVGFSDTTFYAEPSSEVYNPATNTWAYLASLPQGTSMTHQDLILIDNTVWLIGGRVGRVPGPMSSAIWIYNISSNTWSRGPEILDPSTGKPMVIAASGSALLGRVLHIFGGFTPIACNGDQNKYHLTLDVDTWLSNKSLPAQWENKFKPLPMPRNHLSAAVLGGKIYAIGGQLGHDCGGGKEVSYCHVYNPSTDTWTQLPSLPTGRSHAEGSTFAIDGKIYIVGGQGSDGKSTNKVTTFDPSANNGLGTWTENLSLALPTIYEGLSATIIGTTFIISHGSVGASKFPKKLTYSRTIVRNPVYKLGFPSECINLNDSSASSLKGQTWLYTIDGTKSYTTSSNASWLVVSKNATGTANPNSVDINVTANPTGLTPGIYNGTITATGTGGGTNYTAATLCVKLTVQQNPQPQYSLNVTTSSNGTITKNPNQPTYTSGTNVILSATPAAGQQFTGWSGDATGQTNPLTITMNADKSIAASFIPAAQYNLSVSVSGNGNVDKNPDQATYSSGTNVILTATPDAGQEFTGWSGDANGQANPLTITMDADKSITATFAPAVQYNLTVTTSGNGTVSKNPNQATYNSGSSVSLSAIPATGQQFSGWSGNVTGNTNPLVVTMNSDKAVTANFIQASTGLITTVKASTGRKYSLSKLAVDTVVYTDRTYQATTVPPFLNYAQFIKTPNNDKTDTSSAVLSFTLTQNATVYIAYDPRGTVLPSWLNSWQKVTGQQVGLHDPEINYMLLYSKDFNAGKVSLGGNLQRPAAGARDNYFVIAIPQQLQKPQNIMAANVIYNSMKANNTKRSIFQKPHKIY